MWFVLPQVNGVLPILPLLFPVLWVLATACGEARVLAQMSKASPSSLVGCSKASRGQHNKKKIGSQKRVSAGAQRLGTEVQPHCGPLSPARVGPELLSVWRSLQAGPCEAGGRPCWFSADTGFRNDPGCPLSKASGALLVGGPHPCSLEASLSRCPFLGAAGQVLGGHSQQLYRSRLLSGTLTWDTFCPRPLEPPT